MQKNIIYKNMSDGPVEVCKDLCNRLMQHQASKATIFVDTLRSMNFENRLKPSFESAKEKFLLVAYDEDKPIGYVFAAAETITEEAKHFRPAWAKGLPEDSQGFYPMDLKTPVVSGALNNLYVMPEYRGMNIGNRLTTEAINWLKKIDDVHHLSVHVSNGNNVIQFYEKFGFEYSHDVFDGFIKAYILNL